MKNVLVCVVLSCISLPVSAAAVVVQSVTIAGPTLVVSQATVRKLLLNDVAARIAQQGARVDLSRKQEIAARIECRRSFTCELLRDTYEARYTQACQETDRAQKRLDRLLTLQSDLNNPRIKIVLLTSKAVNASELYECM